MASSGANSRFTEVRPTYNPDEDGYLQNSQFKYPLRLIFQKRLRNLLYLPLTDIMKTNKITVFNYNDQCTQKDDMMMAIYGQPENVSNALLQIMTIVERSREQYELPGNVSMRMVMTKHIMYRKKGEAIINAFQEISTKTETFIVVSDLHEEHDRDKVITISGYTNNVCRAGIEIKTLTSQCFDLPYSKFTPHYNSEAISHNTDKNGHRIIPKESAQYFTINRTINSIQDKPKDDFKFFNYFPDSVNVLIPLIDISLLIGPAGTTRSKIKGATGVIDITVLEPGMENPIGRGQICQKINIIGKFDARIQAVAIIFYMMWKAGYGPALEDVMLSVEVGCVPRHKVEKIIGLENETRCHINPFIHGSNIYVRVIGNFYSFELAQRKIQSILESP